MTKRTFRIASIASEVAPYSKTGGLADVAKALPKALANLGHKVVIITPYYSFIRKQGLKLKHVEFGDTISIGSVEFNTYYKLLQFSNNLHIYFVGNEELFGGHSKIYGYPNDNIRFMYFDLSALKLLERIDFQPDIIHCHDWQAGLIPEFIAEHGEQRPSLSKAATVFTLHNLSFQMGGNWWEVPDEHQDDAKVALPDNHHKIRYLNFSKRAIHYANVINTVSERYAQEILTPEFGQGLDRCLRKRESDVYGIINGIDYTVYNPSFDQNIRYRFDWNSLRRKAKNKLSLQRELGLEPSADTPLIGVVNRLTEQKGFNLIMESMDTLMHLKLQIIVVGSGDKDYISFFRKVQKKHPKRFTILTPFTEELASKVYAASDMFLMPSRFEPCGLSQLISLRYGSIPIVRETGGLSDTVLDFNPKTRKGNGFVFKRYHKDDFLMALVRALENYKYPQVWEFLTWNGMRQTYSWELPAKEYLKLYKVAIKNKHSQS